MAINFAFLHGGGQGGWVWDEAIAALEHQASGTPVRTLALDVPGCGSKRGRDSSTMTLDDVVTELQGDLLAAKLQDVILVGHSQAGTLLPRQVEKQPALYRQLIYVSCCAPLPGQNVVQMIGKGRHGSHPDEVGWPLDPATTPQQERNRRMFCNDMDDAEASQFLARLGRDRWPDQTMAEADWRYDHLTSMPATYVLCLKDGILPLPWQETFAQRLKAQRMVRLDAGHQVMNTRPQALAEALLFEALTARQG